MPWPIITPIVPTRDVSEPETNKPHLIKGELFWRDADHFESNQQPNYHLQADKSIDSALAKELTFEERHDGDVKQA